MFSSPLALIGFIVGAGTPVTYGIIQLQAHQAYAASLPAGEVACGTAALGAFGLILVVSPIGGIAGTVIGALASRLWSWIQAFHFHADL